jgi:hypothetical protein
MASLQNIKAQLAELEDRLLAAGGEMEPNSELEQAWDAAQNALMAKVDDYAEYILFLDAKAEALRKAAKQVSQRAQALDSLASRLRKNADFAMGESNGVLEGDAYVIKRVRNPPAVTIIDEWRVKLCAPYCVERGEPLANGTYELRLSPDGGTEVVPLRLNKKLVADALKAGQRLDGAVLTQGHRIDVR